MAMFNSYFDITREYFISVLSLRLCHGVSMWCCPASGVHWFGCVSGGPRCSRSRSIKGSCRMDPNHFYMHSTYFKGCIHIRTPSLYMYMYIYICVCVCSLSLVYIHIHILYIYTHTYTHVLYYMYIYIYVCV